MKNMTLAALLAAISGNASAQSVLGTVTPPSIDRWDYPFASQPGAEPSIPIFAAIRQAGFDDRDALFLLAFDTGSLVPGGCGDSRYLIANLRVTVWNAADNRFEYDPSFDSVRTSYDAADAQYLPDSDLGKPVELFGAGYRNGWSLTTYQESSSFSQVPPFPPQEGIRNVFAAVFDVDGHATDIGRQVRQHFEAVPMAIGRNESLTPGQLIPAGTPLTFDINLGDPATHAYFARGFNAGRLAFIITGLHPASGGPGGGTGDAHYPAFYTKENAVAQTLGFIPIVTLDVAAFPGADFNLDGGVDGADVEAFFRAWEAADNRADFNMDGGVDGPDVEAFFVAWEGG